MYVHDLGFKYFLMVHKLCLYILYEWKHDNFYVMLNFGHVWPPGGRSIKICHKQNKMITKITFECL